jgi:catechol 2,3-dioxygenase-like lactoylglutathione lyase family enzyme
VNPLDQIDHLAVQVDNIERAVSWYRQHFNCQAVYCDQSWALLKFRNLNVALVLPGQHPAHLAVLGPDPCSFGAPDSHRDGTSSVYISDPWGNTVEVMHADGELR